MQNIEELRLVLKRARGQQRIHESEQEASWRAEMDHRSHWLRTYLLPRTRPAMPQDYANWLKGYLLQGGKITHVYEYPMPWHWYVARTAIHLIPLHGAQAIGLIVPENVQLSHTDYGHNMVFYMQDYRPSGLAPLYSDIDF